MNIHRKPRIYSALCRSALGIALLAIISCFGGQVYAVSNNLSVFFTDGVAGRWSVDGGVTMHPANYTEPYLNFSVPFPATITFGGVRGYYAPAATTVTFTADNQNLQPSVTYTPWDANLGVRLIYSNAAPWFSPNNATWSLIGPTNYTVYVGGGTGTMLSAPCPASPEFYTITFNDIIYQGVTMYRNASPNQSQRINPGDTVIFTNTYTRITGEIQVNNVTENATWQIIQFPSDFTQYTSSDYLTKQTNSMVMTNCPAGTYVIQFYRLNGYDYPAINPQTNFLSEGHPAEFEGIYQSGLRLRFHTVTSAEEPNWPGIGDGYVMVIPTNAGVYENGSWFFTAGTEISVFAMPTNVGAYESFFYMWRGTEFDATFPDLKYQNPISLTIDQSMDIDVVFSREFFTYDNVGDLDADMLPDEWERRQGVQWPTNSAGPNGMYGRYGNPDLDTIPTTGTNAPVTYQILTGNNIVLFGTNTISTPFSYERYFGVNGSAPSYPIPSPVLLRGGYIGTNGVPFANLYECRGLDLCYRTNGPSGPVPNDDPGTSPILADSDIDGLRDGWEYYFWYWRSADAAARGLTNANLDWMLINPMVWNEAAWTDTDGDGLMDLEEYGFGTDPTHVDTDGDFTDDWWEMHYRIVLAGNLVCNPLSYIDAQLNPDADSYAFRGTSILTNGTIGIAFTNVPVLRGSTNWNQVWLDNDTNGLFTMYHDTILTSIDPMTNGMTGTNVPAGSLVVHSGPDPYLGGVPVWASLGNTNVYQGTNSGDVILIDFFMKHSAIYLADPPPLPPQPWNMTPPPVNENPGVNSFNPQTGWGGGPDTVNYTTRDEYLGGGYVGRLSWGPGGNMLFQNDDDLNPGTNGYTNPSTNDSDGDLMPDGWEFYVGLNPNSIGGISDDAGGDPDGDGLNNQLEWANTSHLLGASTNLNKPWPSDPGQLISLPPNDPHPEDTDWDGVPDGEENAQGLNPCITDTDGDGMPDGWELYAGSDPRAADAFADPDGDGLQNYQEYLTGGVDEWQRCDPNWGYNFFTRIAMPWEAESYAGGEYGGWFMPPDPLSCPSSLVTNGIFPNGAWLRSPSNYPARAGGWDEVGFLIPGVRSYLEYHTTLASSNAMACQGGGASSSIIIPDPKDSDGDGMDDYWEVFHGLNPLRGRFDLHTRSEERYDLLNDPPWGADDAQPTIPGYQWGYWGGTYPSTPYQLLDAIRAGIVEVAGPLNLGLPYHDPDMDGLANLDEYTYLVYPDDNRPVGTYHTDPTPYWRTDNFYNTWMDSASVAMQYIMGPLPQDWRGLGRFAFLFETTDGFDTDNDGVGDFAEINRIQGAPGFDPQDARNPSRNRALFLNGKDDFARTQRSWTAVPWNSHASLLTRFCVEAWVNPMNPASGRDQVIIAKSTLIGANNFRLGINAQGLPYILYNGAIRRSILMAQASTSHRLAANKWTHVAGVYDGTKLSIYVNGEESSVLQTRELPYTGFEALPAGDGPRQSIIVGAEDNKPNVPGFPNEGGVGATVIITNGFYHGYLDEIRVWDGARTRQDIIANKNRRLPQAEVNVLTNLYAYYTFDDVPDPTYKDEAIVPPGMADLDPTLLAHPPISWWQAEESRSRIYTGSLTAPYNYMVKADNHANHRLTIPPIDDMIHTVSNSLPAAYCYTANPYGAAYTDMHPIGGNYRVVADQYSLLLCMWARAAAVTPSWLDTIENDPDATDVDGDGLPDNWESLYGLDPNDPYGDNGAWGDPDLDGLNNRGEYLAGTNPFNSDTDGDGIGDYDDNAGPGTLTWGELYTDGDGMPDEWEVENGLDPYHYDADADSDGDGWSNLSEYLASSNPSDVSSFPSPAVIGMITHYSLGTGTLVVVGYQTNTMDGVPTGIKAGAESQVDQRIGFANGSAVFTGRLPIIPIPLPTIVTVSCDNGTRFTFQNNKFSAYTGGGGSGNGTIDYTETGLFTVQWPENEKPWKYAAISVQYDYNMPSANVFSMSGFKEGDVYLMAFYDMNGNGEWDPGESLGMPENQPLKTSINGISQFGMNIVDTPAGYGRFKWNSSVDETVVINNISMQGAPMILSRFMRAPRDFFCEWDFKLNGFWGLPTGSYQWWAAGTNGSFNINWPGTQAKPYLIYPRGERLIYARNIFQWTMDAASSRYHMQIIRSDGVTMLDNYYIPAAFSPTGIYSVDMPIMASELGDGVYFWRVAGMTPNGESEWADWQTFEVNLTTDAGSRSISGNINYYGKVRANYIVVEAFASQFFDGRPESRVTLALPSTSDPMKGAYSLTGLRAGAYSVRAYIDTEPAMSSGRNGSLDSWESYGIVKNSFSNSSDYAPEVIDLYNQRIQFNRKVVIRDHNTDNDQLPDAWEMMHFGNLDQTGPMDFDGDGIDNVTEYALERLNTSPIMVDSDRDRLSDYSELAYDGSLAYNPYNSATKGGAGGTDTSATTWDTDGDQFFDGLEVRLYRTDPLDPTSYPAGVAPGRLSWKAPADFDGDSATDLAVYDPVNGTWFIMSGSGTILAWNESWGGPGYIPVAGDYDGDFRTDMVVYHEATGYWFGRHIQALGGNVIFWGAQWGGPGLTPVAGDFDGDLVSDFAVYYKPTGAWYIMSANGSILSMGYSLGGAVGQAVSGDYNADSQADMAVYANGNWACSGVYRGALFSANWGSSGVQPVSGDFDGDGIADMAVYSEAAGTWYISTLSGRILVWGEQWGGPGFSPLVCDLNGDGASDVAAYDRATGLWYAKVAGGNVIVWGAQWGGTGLVPVSE